jgi:hypothetical protein
MPQTRMFRDRVVSMEQTLEGGEKHLELLKAICREALPEFEYRGHSLDHERDLFTLALEAPDGRKKTVAWTRMVLFDVERIPAVAGDLASPLRPRLVRYLRDSAARSEIVVTFRHLEEGWVETPEPRREKKRGRRGRGQRRAGGERPEQLPARAPAVPGREPVPSGRSATPPRPEKRPAIASAAEPQAVRPASPTRKRRFRRRRRGGHGQGKGGPPPSPQSGP